MIRVFMNKHKQSCHFFTRASHSEIVAFDKSMGIRSTTKVAVSWINFKIWRKPMPHIKFQPQKPNDLKLLEMCYLAEVTS
jgi:hypothetical protein